MKLKTATGVLTLSLIAMSAVPALVAPGTAHAAGVFTIPSVPLVGGAGSELAGPGTVGPNGNGVFGSPGVGPGSMSFGGLSSTLGATGAANGGVGGTSGGFTGTTGGVAGAPGGLAAGQL